MGLKKTISIVCFLLFITSLLSQNKPSGTRVRTPDSVYSDCGRARVIKLNKTIRIGPTLAPESAGLLNELSVNKQRSHYIFEKEHHSAWYRLRIETAGNLCFDLIPLKKEDDYDFVIFKSEGNFCEGISKGRVSPVRSCISRNKKNLEGRTGLSNTAKKKMIHEGIGDAYVKSIPVKKGEEYYLVLDNVYPEGKGHILHFYFAEQVTIAGQVTDEYDRPMQAELVVTNPKGDTIITTESSPNGRYKFSVELNSGEDYSLHFYNDSSFVYTMNFTTKDTGALKAIKTVLPKLTEGKKYSIGSINFYGGSPEYIPGAVPAIKNLWRLMQKNDSLKIMIIGHVNGCDIVSQTEALVLSEMRAAAIRDYLTKKKISLKRIQTKGVGCKEMLYPLRRTAWEEEQNRRVEILVTNY